MKRKRCDKFHIILMHMKNHRDMAEKKEADKYDDRKK